METNNSSNVQLLGPSTQLEFEEKNIKTFQYSFSFGPTSFHVHKNQSSGGESYDFLNVKSLYYFQNPQIAIGTSQTAVGVLNF